VPKLLSPAKALQVIDSEDDWTSVMRMKSFRVVLVFGGLQPQVVDFNQVGIQRVLD